MAAATLLLAGCSTGGDSASAAKASGAKMADVMCSGVNSCKGTSACATSACQGQNSCKGKGWIKTSKSECDAKGGKVIG